MTAITLPSVPSSERRRGAALPIVLLFAALLAGLAASAMRSSLSGVRAASAFAEAARADELGRGAGDALAYHLATHDAASRRGGRIAMRLPDAEVTIDYRSESARIDANLAPLDLIKALLGAAGADPAEATAAAARAGRFRALAARKITQAKQAAAGASSIVPVSTAPVAPAPQTASFDGPSPAGAPAASGGVSQPPPLAIHDTDEVAEAWGLPDALARRVLPSLTVSNGTPQVDPVLADKLVLAALLGGDERVDDYVDRRAHGFLTEESALDLVPVPSRRFASFNDSETVRAMARIVLPHGFARRYEMVLAPPRPSADATRPTDGSSAPVVVSWRRLP